MRKCPGDSLALVPEPRLDCCRGLHHRLQATHEDVAAVHLPIVVPRMSRTRALLGQYYDSRLIH